jgi:hypothetical protein
MPTWTVRTGGRPNLVSGLDDFERMIAAAKNITTVSAAPAWGKHVPHGYQRGQVIPSSPGDGSRLVDLRIVRLPDAQAGDQRDQEG